MGGLAGLDQFTNNCPIWAGALVKWLWEETHVLKVMSSNPVTIYWTDIFHIYLL